MDTARAAVESLLMASTPEGYSVMRSDEYLNGA